MAKPATIQVALRPCGSAPRSAYIIVPGIRTRPADNGAWNVRMADDIMTRCAETAPVASEFRYYAGPLLRRLRQHEHARQAASLVEKYWLAGYRLHLVGHSNGCDLIERTIRMVSWVTIDSLHLISAASSADFEANGYNAALVAGAIGHIYCYTSRSDTAVGIWAALSHRYLRGWGLGYGRLGYTGPKNVPAAYRPSRVDVIRRDHMEHGDWFTAGHYRTTLDAVTVAERVHE